MKNKFLRLGFPALVATISITITIGAGAQSPVADSFNPGVDNVVRSIAIQPDGKILVGGWEFTRVAGRPRTNLARLNSDGSLDEKFDPILKPILGTPRIFSLAIQPDEKVLIGGHFGPVGGQSRTNLVRLHNNGSVDVAFAPNASADAEYPDGVYRLAEQPDGKLLVGETCAYCIGALARVNADGTRDSEFLPVHTAFGPYTIAVQPDGKILMGGYFENIAGHPETNIVRLNKDGTLDADFTAGTAGRVDQILLHPDGKILLSGFFSSLPGQPPTSLARLNPEGTLDFTFGPSVDNGIEALALQADGKIIIGGSFTMVNGQRRPGLARLNPDGSLDSEFDAGVEGPVNHSVTAVALQGDGKIVVGGDFTKLSGESRSNIGRLNNTGPATQNLNFDGSSIIWLRGGTSPEVWRTEFDASPDGVGWTRLGEGQRTAGGWQLASTRVPAGSIIRARGFVSTTGTAQSIVQTDVATMPSFTRITTGSIATTAGYAVGAGWADYDNDGFPDLYIPRFNGQDNLLFKNKGGLAFEDASKTLLSIGGNGQTSNGCTWGDYDNDGFVDLYVGNSTANFLFHNKGDGTFEKITAAPIGTDITDTGGCTWVDYDNDGNLDLFVINLNTSKLLYHNEGNGIFTRIKAGRLVTDSAAYGASWADYDNDGFMDAFVIGPNNSGPNCLYHNDRNGTFTKITAGPVVTGSANSRAGAWGDYNNDGLLDLFVVNRGGAGNFLFQNNGDGTFTKVTDAVPALSRGEFQGCAWGDFDNDGYLDLLLAEHFQSEQLYHNNGDGTFTRITTGRLVTDGGNSGAVTWEDYDNDGFLDVFVANGVNISSQVSFLYHNDGNKNAWIKVKCVGTVSNRSAIGAKVRIEAEVNGKRLQQLRQIGGGDGIFSPTSLIAHFGLGDATNILKMEIEWPSGTVQTFSNVTPRQTLTVIEPPRLISNDRSSITLQGGRGMSYQIQFSPDLSAWSELERVTVTNANRLVKSPATSGAATKMGFYRAVQL